jgi:hypothetical protein
MSFFASSKRNFAATLELYYRGDRMQANDSLVIMLLLAAAALWLYVRLKHRSGIAVMPAAVPRHEEITVPSEEAADLFQEHGYEWMAGKIKIPVYITMDGQAMESRLFADGFVRKGEDVFVVKFARERKPIDMTGSSLRDHLLVYSLLYEGTAGVLYADVPNRTIHTIRFEVEL